MDQNIYEQVDYRQNEPHRIACKTAQRRSSGQGTYRKVGDDGVSQGEMVDEKKQREERVMESKAGQSVFNWLCRLEGQRSRAQHGAVTLHYSQWPHNESLCNQLPTDQSFKTHTHARTHTLSVGSIQIPRSLAYLFLGSNLISTCVTFFWNVTWGSAHTTEMTGEMIIQSLRWAKFMLYLDLLMLNFKVSSQVLQDQFMHFGFFF